MTAVAEARTVMSWWKLQTEEQPPPEIWGLDQDLDAWWEDVRVKREAKYGPTDGGSSEPMEQVDQTGNEYAKRLREQHGI